MASTIIQIEITQELLDYMRYMIYNRSITNRFMPFVYNSIEENCPDCEYGILLFGESSQEWLPCALCGYEKG